VIRRIKVVAWNRLPIPVASSDEIEGITLQTVGDELEHISYIMDNKGWDVAGEYQRRWMRAEARTAPDEALKQPEFDGLPIDTDRTMDWILNNSKKTRKPYDTITNRNYYWDDHAARSELYKQVNEILEQPGAPQEATFGELPDDISGMSNAEIFEYHWTHTTFIPISYYSSGVFDAVGTALGRFHYYIMPQGTAHKTREGIFISITNVHVHASDVYEFNGFQPLGHWGPPNHASIFPRVAFPPLFFTSFLASNGRFREYRDDTGFGGDFVIVTDPKTTKLAQPLRGNVRSDGSLVPGQDLHSNGIHGLRPSRSDVFGHVAGVADFPTRPQRQTLTWQWRRPIVTYTLRERLQIAMPIRRFPIWVLAAPNAP